jgi:phosphoglycerate dehydrogenase-like enzyme
MLAQARQLPEAVRSQLAGNKWRYEALRPAMRVLSDEVVLVLGYGAIARRLIELLSPFRLKIVALRRKVQGNETVETHAIDQLHRFLREADHVVNLLPSNSSTDELIDAECFATMKPNAVFYNVGRGTTVKQTDLVAALNSEELLAAYLDVTDPEPLPADSPLWSARNCWITPHVAGGHQDEESHMVRHFLTNLRRFESGQPLIDRIV